MTKATLCAAALSEAMRAEARVRTGWQRRQVPRCFTRLLAAQHG